MARNMVRAEAVFMGGKVNVVCAERRSVIGEDCFVGWMPLPSKAVQTLTQRSRRWGSRIANVGIRR